MKKMVCYGVRPIEVAYFNELNKEYGYDLKLVELGLNHENVKEALGSEIVMVRGNCKADKKNLTLLKENGLEILLTRTVGFDHIDLECAKELKIKVARVSKYSPNAIAELALTQAMSLLRHTVYTIERTSNKNFKVDATMFSKEIRNCTVGVIGVGKIGYTTAKLFKGLGANVIAYDIHADKKVEAKEIVKFMPLDEVVKNSDIISIHMPYVRGVNDNFIDEDFINKMKDGAILINTSRGEIQDVKAIIKAIKSEKLSGFATDVLANESSIFMKDFSGEALDNKDYEELVNLYPRALITPHMGSYTDEALINMIEISYENAKDFILTGKCPNSLID